MTHVLCGYLGLVEMAPLHPCLRKIDRRHHNSGQPPRLLSLMMHSPLVLLVLAAVLRHVQLLQY